MCIRIWIRSFFWSGLNNFNRIHNGKKMNRHDEEAAAIQKRVDAAKEYKRKREEYTKDAHQCYLAYMKLR